jgi:hypothetical protein
MPLLCMFLHFLVAIVTERKWKSISVVVNVCLAFNSVCIHTRISVQGCDKTFLLNLQQCTVQSLAFRDHRIVQRNLVTGMNNKLYGIQHIELKDTCFTKNALFVTQ